MKYLFFILCITIIGCKEDDQPNIPTEPRYFGTVSATFNGEDWATDKLYAVNSLSKGGGISLSFSLFDEYGRLSQSVFFFKNTLYGRYLSSGGCRFAAR